MTVSYTGEVANSSAFGCFWRILCKWRGSVYKLIWRELLAYITLLLSINLIYKYALEPEQQKVFESFHEYFATKSESIPMSFVLGFYVSLIVKRWWEQYRLLPWPDSLALFVSAAIPGVDERGRLMRRNILRYAMLSYVITLQKVSFRVKKRFPTWQHLVDAGLMMECEKKIFEMMDEKTDMSKYWMPLIWATNIINRARKEGHILNDQVVQTMLRELSDIRQRLGSLIGYDTVCVPLVYTQVVTLSVYTYFLSALMGSQLTKGDSPRDITTMFFPFFTILQFCFYIGWLKVAEVLINPFGEDDDDIELNWLIDRHIKAAYMIVDEMHEEHPELLKDQYWDEVVPKNLPYTVASEQYRRREPKGSAESYVVKPADSLYANLMPPRKSMPDDAYADYESVDTPLVERRKNWFQRQMSRMSSVRSASTTYSSNGLFTRGRINSVYSSPESGLPMENIPEHQHHFHHPHKMSLYDRIVGRKSGRANPKRATVKMNGSSIPMSLKNRPRIPTPDVTKEVVDRELRLANMHHASGMLHTGLTTGSFVPQQQNSAPPHHIQQQNYPPDINSVLLSPIQELDSPPGTGQKGQHGTSALATSVLNEALTSAGINSLKFPSASATSGFKNSPQFQPQPGFTITEVPSGSDDDGATTSSTASVEGDRSRKASVTSQAKRGEVYV